jgi:hypothetical protein
MNTYYCWITGVLKTYQDSLICGLVHKGYMVGAAEKNGKVIVVDKDESPAFVMALSVYKLVEPGTLSAQKVYEDVAEILLLMKAYYYSVVVSAASDCIWAGSNFALEKKEQPLDKKDVN